MKRHDLLSERMIIGILVVVSFDLIAATVIYVIVSPAPKDGAVLALISSLAGALVAPIGQIVGSVFRNDRIDQARAETAATMANMVAASATPPTTTEPTA